MIWFIQLLHLIHLSLWRHNFFDHSISLRFGSYLPLNWRLRLPLKRSQRHIQLPLYLVSAFARLLCLNNFLDYMFVNQIIYLRLYSRWWLLRHTHWWLVWLLRLFIIRHPYYIRLVGSFRYRGIILLLLYLLRFFVGGIDFWRFLWPRIVFLI